MRTRISRRVAILLATAIFAIGAPIGLVLASHQFSDVPNSNPFHGDISAVADAGVTSGCGGGKFCPDRNVTRAEMAAFMNRLGALASNKTPVVNADKVDGLNSTDFGVAGLRADSSGSVLSWFNKAGGKPTITKTGTGVYNVVVPGRSFNANTNFVASANIVGSGGGMVAIGSVGGGINVYTFNVAGAAADAAFMLTVFDASTGG